MLITWEYLPETVQCFTHGYSCTFKSWDLCDLYLWHATTQSYISRPLFLLHLKFNLTGKQIGSASSVLMVPTPTAYPVVINICKLVGVSISFDHFYKLKKFDSSKLPSLQTQMATMLSWLSNGYLFLVQHCNIMNN